MELRSAFSEICTEIARPWPVTPQVPPHVPLALNKPHLEGGARGEGRWNLLPGSSRHVATRWLSRQPFGLIQNLDRVRVDVH